MPHFYRIYLLDNDHRIPLAYDFVGPDDLGALREAKRHLEKNAVEIWQGARMVARLARDGARAQG